ncbi:S-adenosyl-L-methionine-dependent methyltransferase [Chlamydoabsidia padenii]|nr:S-adenosyl-L-methionine-dependent methyltransferase [Chlamydoabsidia padenii]
MGTKHSKSIASSQDIQPTSREKSQHVQSSPSIMVDGRTYHDIGSSAYCLPRDELEQDRLNSQHFSLKVIFDGNILPIIASSLAPEAKILDVGCGSSTWCLEMALDYPRAEIRGLDMADMFPTTIRPQNVNFDLHNALEGLPYENNTFDLVHMRLLIAAWRKDEWGFLLKEIYRVLKPGGYVQLVESDFTERGHDPWIVEHFDTLLPEHGFDIEEKVLKMVNYGEPGNPISQEMLWNWKSAMKAMKPILARHLLRQPQDYERFIDRYIQECEQSGLFLQLAAFAGRKPL